MQKVFLFSTLIIVMFCSNFDLKGQSRLCEIIPTGYQVCYDMYPEGIFTQSYYGCGSYEGGIGYITKKGRKLILRFDSTLIQTRIECKFDSSLGSKVSVSIIDIVCDNPGRMVLLSLKDNPTTFTDDEGNALIEYKSGSVKFYSINQLRLQINPQKDVCNKYNIRINLDPRINGKNHGKVLKFKRSKKKVEGKTIYSYHNLFRKTNYILFQTINSE